MEPPQILLPFVNSLGRVGRLSVHVEPDETRCIGCAFLFTLQHTLRESAFDSRRCCTRCLELASSCELDVLQTRACEAIFDGTRVLLSIESCY
jgi:hypothetical protein